MLWLWYDRSPQARVFEHVVSKRVVRSSGGEAALEEEWATKVSEPWGMRVQPYFLFPAGFLSADAMWLPGCCWVPLLCWAEKQSQPFPRQLLFSSSAAAAGEWPRTVVHVHLSTVDTKMALWESSLKPSFWHPNWTVEHTAQSSTLMNQLITVLSYHSTSNWTVDLLKA